ncbi:EH signature domain-containing protein [Bacteroidota bacterium]
MKYIQPDYESLKPRKLKSTVKTLYSTKGVVSRRNSYISPEELSNYGISKIASSYQLLKYSAYHLNHSELSSIRDQLFTLIINYIRSKPKKFNQLYKQLFYRYLENPDDRKLHQILNEFYDSVSGSFKNFLVEKGKTFLKDNFPFEVSKMMIHEIDKNPDDFSEEEFLFCNYRLLTSYKSYQKIIITYLDQVVRYKVFFNRSEHFKDLIETIKKDEILKKMFEKIIDKIPTEKSQEKRYNYWIEYIHQELGDPYAEKRYKWIGIKEETKNKFNSWIVLNDILYFFDRKDPTRRADFWKKYVYEILKIEYISEANEAVLMLTKRNHLMIEFLQTGNAFYIFEINGIDHFYQVLKKIKSLYRHGPKIHYLKGHNELTKISKITYTYSYYGWHHHSGWQYRFDTNLKDLGYRQKK